MKGAVIIGVTGCVYKASCIWFTSGAFNPIFYVNLYVSRKN